MVESPGEISMEELDKVVELARLTLSEQERTLFLGQIQGVLSHVHQIEKVKTVGVEPLVTPTDIETFWREDQADHHLDAESAVGNAPEKVGHLFKVPPVVGV